MLIYFIAITIIILQSFLAAVVASRAWDYLPARLYTIFATNLILVVASTIARNIAESDLQSTISLSLLLSGVAMYSPLLTLLVSSVLIPEWWAGRRPIRLIILPYLIVVGLVLIDLLVLVYLTGAGIFISGVRFEEGIARFNLRVPSGLIALSLSLVGTIVLITSLVVVAIRDPRRRRLAGFTAGMVLISLILTQAAQRIPAIVQIGNLVQTLPVIVLLAYLALRTRLFTPTRAALDLALTEMSEAVAIIDTEGALIYANARAEGLGLHVGHQLADEHIPPVIAQLALDAQRGATKASLVEIGERRIDVTVSPVRDLRGLQRGVMLLGRDITEAEARREQLEAERARLSQAVSQLETERNERQQLAAQVLQLSLPTIPVLPGVLVMPLIGDFDGNRIGEFTSVLLQSIERTRSHTALIDITGVSFLDTSGAQALLTSVRAAGLLGARTVLVGVRPEIAQALVALGLPLDEIDTAASLESAVTQQLRAALPR